MPRRSGARRPRSSVSSRRASSRRSWWRSTATTSFALLPVDRQLSLKAVGKRAALARPEEAERVTGYVKGGTSVLGGRRRLRVVVDESALQHETIVVNGGRRGLQIELAPVDLLRVTGGATAVLGTAAGA